MNTLLTKESLDCGYFPNCIINFDYNILKDDQVEYNFTVRDVEDYSVLSNLSDYTESKDTLKAIYNILKRTLAHYLAGKHTYKQTLLLLCETTETLDFFGMETYNGWDIEMAQEYHKTKKAALISLLTYAIIKIHLTIKLT